MDVGDLVVWLLITAMWLTPPVICFVKGKMGLGLIGLLGPVVATAVALGVALVTFLWLDAGPDGTNEWEELGFAIYAFIAGALVWLGVVGASFVTAAIGAIRLGRPSSRWARNYPPDKLAQAEARFAAPSPTPVVAPPG
ncbi:MAG: hypothetical protein AAGD35_08640 [Actinomycetota bacterium]